MDKDKKCDVLIKCGGCYAINVNKTSSFCDGYILPSDDQMMNVGIDANLVSRVMVIVMVHVGVIVMAEEWKCKNQFYQNLRY